MKEKNLFSRLASGLCLLLSILLITTFFMPVYKISLPASELVEKESSVSFSNFDIIMATTYDSFDDYIGQDISFKAFILSSSNKESKISLKICDGSFSERKDIWFEIPKKMIMSLRYNPIDINRGEFIEVKRAKIVSKNRIFCELHSQIKVMR